MKSFLKDKRNAVILLLGVLFVIGIPQSGPRFAFWVLAGAVISAASDFFISGFFGRQEAFPKSAIISGLIVSGILDYRQPWFILVIFCILPALSKRFIRFRQKHIFNPAGFSLFLATLFRIPLTWSIESNTIVIIAFGIYLAYSCKKLPQVLGFLVLFLGIFRVFNMDAIGLISWFFVFVMLIEPKTSGYGTLKGVLFGAVAGAFCFLTFRYIPAFDPFVFSLLLANVARIAMSELLL